MVQNENKSSSLDEHNFQGNIPQNPRKNIRTMNYEDLLRQVLEQLSSQYQQRLQSILSHKGQTEKESMIKSLSQIRDEVDQCLLILVFEVQQYPPEPQHLQPRKKNNNQTRPNPENPSNNALRNIALTRLINKIEQSGKLFVTGKGNYPKELYNHAKQETLLYVSRNIHKYDPSQGLVMTWVNFKLGCEFKESIGKYIKQQEEKKKEISLDTPLNSEDESSKTLKDMIAEPEEELFLSEQVYNCIDEDPEGIFKNAHVEDHPEANFREIALRFMKGEKISDIARDLKLPRPTIDSCYKRGLAKFARIIEKYINNNKN